MVAMEAASTSHRNQIQTLIKTSLWNTLLKWFHFLLANWNGLPSSIVHTPSNKADWLLPEGAASTTSLLALSLHVCFTILEAPSDLVASWFPLTVAGVRSWDLRAAPGVSEPRENQAACGLRRSDSTRVDSANLCQPESLSLRSAGKSPLWGVSPLLHFLSQLCILVEITVFFFILFLF